MSWQLSKRTGEPSGSLLRCSEEVMKLSLQLSNVKDRESVLAAVKHNGLALQFAVEKFRGDRDIVLAAVEQDCRALQFAAEYCRGDRAIVLAAVKKNWRALQLAAESCRGD
eukprot:1975422-Amphidinium_carterae.1